MALNDSGHGLQVQGPLNIPEQGARIPLIQAGASESGRDFAASVADLVFAPTPDKEAALELRRDLGRRLGHTARAWRTSVAATGRRRGGHGMARLR